MIFRKSAVINKTLHTITGIKRLIVTAVTVIQQGKDQKRQKILMLITCLGKKINLIQKCFVTVCYFI